MSVAVVSPGPPAAASPGTRASTSLAAKAYAALQHDPAQPPGQVRRAHGPHGGHATALPDGKAAQNPASKPPVQGALNIFV